MTEESKVGAHLILIRLLLQSDVINKVRLGKGRKHPLPSLLDIEDLGLWLPGVRGGERRQAEGNLLHQGFGMPHIYSCQKKVKLLPNYMPY